MWSYTLFYTTLAIGITKLLVKFTNGVCRSNACLVGKTALITGGNVGIGFQIALNLASRGCRIIIASRNASHEVKEKIFQLTGNPNVVIKHLDLASVASIRALAVDLNQTEEKLDILINNSGAGGSGSECTSDGLNKVVQINHLGPFLLTHLLVDLLKKSDQGRIIFHTSMFSFLNNLNEHNLNDRTNHGTFIREFRLYANTKLCNIIAAEGFARKLQTYNINSNAVHPGMVNTAIWMKSLQGLVPRFLLLALYKILEWIMKSPMEGAQTAIYLAVSRTKLKGVTGKFFADGVPFIKPSKAGDRKFCDLIWKQSEDLIQLKPNERLS